MFQEIETEDDNSTATVNMAKLKSYTGNDVSISARTLYKKQEDFIPTFQVVICLNNLPKLSTVDGGTKRRVRNIPFESKFVDNVDDEKWEKLQNVNEIDRSLKQKIPSMGPTFMRILLDQYVIYINNSVHVPSKISVATDEFIEQHNDDMKYIIESLIRPRLQFTDNKRDFVQLKFIHNWVQEHSFKKIQQRALYDLLEDEFSDNYNPRYRDVNKKDFNKCLEHCIFNLNLEN